jgi:hypothetical protein
VPGTTVLLYAACSNDPIMRLRHLNDVPVRGILGSIFALGERTQPTRRIG